MAQETDPAAWLALNWAFHALRGRASRSRRLFFLVTNASAKLVTGHLQHKLELLLTP